MVDVISTTSAMEAPQQQNEEDGFSSSFAFVDVLGAIVERSSSWRFADGCDSEVVMSMPHRRPFSSFLACWSVIHSRCRLLSLI